MRSPSGSRLALSSSSKHLLALLGAILLGAQTPSLARAQQVIQLSDSLLAATEVLPVSMRNQTSRMWNYRFGEFAVLDRRGGTERSADRKRGPLGDRRIVRRDTTTFRYSVKGSDSAQVAVRVGNSSRTERRLPLFAIGDRIESPEDTVEVAYTTMARFVFDGDTAGAWQLRIVERSGTDVPDGYSFEGTVTNGSRTIRLLPVSSPERPKRGRLRDLFRWRAHGFVFEENGRAFAAVQYTNGNARSIYEGVKVWMPKSVTARERLELAAIFTAVLENGQVNPGRVGVPTPSAPDSVP